jgi:hypothetical protein
MERLKFRQEILQFERTPKRREETLVRGRAEEELITIGESVE